MRLLRLPLAPRWLGLVAVLVVATASGQLDSKPGAVARSVSGQFVVLAKSPAAVRPPWTPVSATGKLLPLEPAFVSVSCERIKQALGEELGITGPWAGRIYLSLQRAITTDDAILVTSEQFRDGWNYRLDVPNPVEPVRFIRAVMQALLLEQANRTAKGRTADIPLWLAEGLIQGVVATRGSQVLLAPPKLEVNKLNIQPVVQERRNADAATFARQHLGPRPVLSFDELSWPKEGQLDGPDGEVYRLSAQWFVAELLRLPEGRTALLTMLRDLGGCLNWQTAFLRAFGSRFPRLLDAEKWWTLTTVHADGTVPGQGWSREETWRRLDELLQVSAEVRRTAGELPETQRVPLRTVLRSWNFARQQPVLQARVTELALARQMAAPELLALVDQYREALAGYLAKRDAAELNLSGGKALVPNASGVVRETIRQLDRLEQQRAQLKPPPAPATAALAPPPAATSAPPAVPNQ